MPSATIHIRIPAITKARWVRESRAERMRLGDWIARAVEAQHQNQTGVTKMDTMNGKTYQYDQLAHDQGFEGHIANPYNPDTQWDLWASYEAGVESASDYYDSQD